MPINLKYHSADNGNCRVYYKSERGTLCCWQLVTRGHFELLACSRDGEPECAIRSDAVVKTEPPKGDESIERELREFLNTAA